MRHENMSKIRDCEIEFLANAQKASLGYKTLRTSLRSVLNLLIPGARFRNQYSTNICRIIQIIFQIHLCGNKEI